MPKTPQTQMPPKPTGDSENSAVERSNRANERVKARMAKLFAEGKLRPECYLDPKTGQPK